MGGFLRGSTCAQTLQIEIAFKRESAPQQVHLAI